MGEEPDDDTRRTIEHKQKGWAHGEQIERRGGHGILPEPAVDQKRAQGHRPGRNTRSSSVCSVPRTPAANNPDACVC